MSVGLVVAAVIAGLVVWVTQRQESGSDVSGSGPAACRQLARQVHAERVDDVRVVDGVTAATWLSRVSPEIDPASYRDDNRVTACLTAIRTAYAIYVIPETGRYALVDRGPFNGKGGIVYAMIALERVRNGGHATTDEPFACSMDSAVAELDVTSTLPSGATRALLCSEGSFFVPRVALTSGVQQLVRAVNAEPLGYTPPNFVCSPYGGAYDYTIVFRYPSGTRSVTWDPCRGMLLGSFTRAGPWRLDQTYLSLLARQVGSRPGSAPPPSCSTVTSSGPAGVGDVRHVVSARYCPDRTGEAGPALTPRQIGLLQRWGRSLDTGESVPEHTCPAPSAGWPRLALTDAWGDHFSLVLMGCGHLIFPSIVNPGAPDRVAHPDGSRRPFERLARQLAVS